MRASRFAPWAELDVVLRSYIMSPYTSSMFALSYDASSAKRHVSRATQIKMLAGSFDIADESICYRTSWTWHSRKACGSPGRAGCAGRNSSRRAEHSPRHDGCTVAQGVRAHHGCHQGRRYEGVREAQLSVPAPPAPIQSSSIRLLPCFFLRR